MVIVYEVTASHKVKVLVTPANNFGGILGNLQPSIYKKKTFPNQEAVPLDTHLITVFLDGALSLAMDFAVFMIIDCATFCTPW